MYKYINTIRIQLPKILRLFHQQPVKFFAYFFGEGADFGKLFLQVSKVVYFGVFADLDKAGIRCQKIRVAEIPEIRFFF
jgi:hypothetical protein